MGLRKGQTNNLNGRPVGSRNKVTLDLRERINDFLTGNWKNLQTEFNNLFGFSRKALKSKKTETLSDYTKPLYERLVRVENPTFYYLKPEMFMPDKSDIKDLGNFVSGKENKSYYAKLKKYISDFAEKNGLKKPKLVSPDELPPELKGTKEKVITDPKTGEKVGEAVLRRGEQMLKEGEDPNKVIDAINKNQKIGFNDVALVKAEIHRLQKATDASEKTFGYDSKEWKEADAKEKAFAIKSKPVATYVKMFALYKSGEKIETGKNVTTVTNLYILAVIILSAIFIDDTLLFLFFLFFSFMLYYTLNMHVDKIKYTDNE